MFEKCKSCGGKIVIEPDIVQVFMDSEGEYSVIDMIRAVCEDCMISSNWVEHTPPDPTMKTLYCQIGEIADKSSKKNKHHGEI